MYNIKSEHAREFMDPLEIENNLDCARNKAGDPVEIERILEKANKGKGLLPVEAATLLFCEQEGIDHRIQQMAIRLKESLYGNRIVLFAPLYLSNYCINGCVYCPYHLDNQNIPRRKLTMSEIEREVIALQDMGHKRLALEMGEHPVENTMDYLEEAIETIYKIKHKNGAIRRVNVNIAATSVENYKRLVSANIGTYILFQETYHRPTYEKMHPTGPKSDYDYHTEAMDRAMEAGIDDVGIGVLFGLDQYAYDFVGLLMHAEHLEARFGVGPHTISVPRVRPADSVNPLEYDRGLSDDLFLLIISLIRLSVPYTGMILSTREEVSIREKALELGVSQLSGGSKTTVGGYDNEDQGKEHTEQFEIYDNRPLSEVVTWLLELGFIPSFCTACYREGRTGDRFMQLVKTGQIANICQSNAIMTLMEYLYDYADASTRKMGMDRIEAEIKKIPNPVVQELVSNKLERIRSGERDFRL